MPLYDVTNKDVLVKPRDAENYDVLQQAMRILDARRFIKDIEVIDDALQDVIREANSKNKLVFTKAGFLVGHSSIVSHVDVNHIWESAELAYPCQLASGRIDEAAAETQLKFIGGMVRWRISVLPDMWLVYRRDSGWFNNFTGKEIKISEYWICDDYEPAPQRQVINTTMLSQKFASVKHTYL